MSIQGDLQDMDLTEIIQFSCRHKENARVSLENGTRAGVVYFANGQVIHAVCDQASGEEAVYRLFSWKEGRFTIEKGVPSPQKTIQISWSALILQGMKSLDEQRQAAPIEAGREAGAGPAIEDILRDLAGRLIGFIAVQVVDASGVVADFVTAEAFYEEKATASLAQTVDQAGRMLAAMKAGAFVETITATEKYRFIIRPLARSAYYIRIVLTNEGSVGAARMYLADKESDLLGILPA